MKFIISKGFENLNTARNVFHLRYDNWDDYSYKTSFDACYYKADGKCVSLGTVKIGYMDMKHGARAYDALPARFEVLEERFFSLGQSEEYYERLSELGSRLRSNILTSLRDVAFDLKIFERVQDEDVLKVSLLRFISSFAVRTQLNRMAQGGARLTAYDFTYLPPTAENSVEARQPALDFHVIPASNPPTNIHVIIGRNGTGKTRLIQNMIRSIGLGGNQFGYFSYEKGEFGNPNEHFANILCVAFSPFDDFSCISGEQMTTPYTYIGLDKESNNLIREIEDQFLNAFGSCIINESKRDRWLNAISTLKSDPTFSQSGIDFFSQQLREQNEIDFNEDIKPKIKQIFSSLSSGHKVILLIITSCVDKLEEKSIVFLDEPENHLHPPLLSAFIRVLSNLLVDRNAVAIISTHSPVVLQEVPGSCVWSLRRAGDNLIAERLPIETFGSSIGQLTSQVFGLEVTDSGFHRMLRDTIAQIDDYDAIVKKFGGRLGDEAKIILRTLLALEREENNP